MLFLQTFIDRSDTMPNWCSNVVEVAHKDPAKLKELMTAFSEGKFCEYAKPVPPELHIVAGRVGADNDPKQIALEEQEKINFAKHGYRTWYDFCVNEWGTKWDVTDECGSSELAEGQTSTTISFESAWSPPIGVYEALVEQGFEVRAHYYEPGMAFVGTWDNGNDDFYEYGGCTSETVVEAIGEELDEMFGISEAMAEWEEDNKEDA
jgi:hypothetical protein